MAKFDYPNIGGVLATQEYIAAQINLLHAYLIVLADAYVISEADADSYRTFIIQPPTISGDYSWHITLPNIGDREGLGNSSWNNKPVTIVNGGATADGGITGLHLECRGPGGGSRILMPLGAGMATNITLQASQCITLFPFYYSLRNKWAWVLTNSNMVIPPT